MTKDLISHPFSARVKATMATGLLFILGIVLWMQLYRDETEHFPTGFAWPAPVPTIPDQENELIFLVQEMGKRKWPEITSEQSGVIGWRMPWDAVLMKPLLHAAPAMREITEKARELPQWQDGMIADGLLSLKEFLLSINILQAKAMELSQAGDGAGALEWCGLAREAVLRYQESSRSLASLMIGTGSQLVLDRALMRILAQSGNSDLVLAQGMTLLGSPMVLRQMLMRSVAEEWREDRSAWPDVRKHPTWSPAKLIGFFRTTQPLHWLANSRYKPQASFNLNVRYFDMLSRLGFREGREARAELKAAREWLGAESELTLWSFESNRAGRVLAGCNYKSLFHIEKNAISKEAARRCCLAAIAAKRWSLAHGGKPPVSLTDLVPDYLSEVPLDPENSQPLLYDATSGVVYSMGVDGSNGIPVIAPAEVFASGDEGAVAQVP